MTRDELLELLGSRLGLEVRGGSARGRMEGRLVEVHVPPTYPAAGATVELAGRIVPPLDLGLGVYRVLVGGAGALPASGPHPVHRFHPALPAEVRIFADEPDRARALLGPIADEVGALFRQSHLLVMTDAVVAMVIDGISSRAVELGLQRLLTLLHRIDNGTDEVPVARALAPRLDDFRELGRARMLELQSTPLGVRGRIGDAEVLAYAARTAVEQYGLAVHLRLVQPLAYELAVRPRAAADAAAPGIGVPVVDDAFVVHGHADFARRAFASPDAQRLLLDLAPHAPTLEGSLLTLRAPELPRDLRAAEQLLTSGHALVAALVEAARAHGSGGPYR